MDRLGVSERRACEVLRQPRATQRYLPEVREDDSPHQAPLVIALLRPMTLRGSRLAQYSAGPTLRHPEMITHAADHLASKLPNARAFSVPVRTAEMLREDLAAAGIPEEDDAGRVVDFHALRHTTGSLLAASGVHPKTAQTIMRHCTIALTLDLYTHTLRGAERAAVDSLPDLAAPAAEGQRPTGTS
jgi:integrase